MSTGAHIPGCMDPYNQHTACTVQSITGLKIMHHEDYCALPMVNHTVCPRGIPLIVNPDPKHEVPAVVAILRQCIDLYEQKNSDYHHPTKEDVGPLSNFMVAEELGIPAYVGALVRTSDKWERIKTLTYKKVKQGNGPSVEDEPLEDTLMDIINYAAITLALYREHKSD